ICATNSILSMLDAESTTERNRFATTPKRSATSALLFGAPIRFVCPLSLPKGVLGDKSRLHSKPPSSGLGNSIAVQFSAMAKNKSAAKPAGHPSASAEKPRKGWKEDLVS